MNERQAVISGIWTLTETHCGTGQADGAVDLPIARESTTGLPVLPSTSLKGVARATLKHRGRSDSMDEGLLVRLFGPEMRDRGTSDPEGSRENKSHFAGALIFTEGRLLAWPLRSLHRPLVWATSPLLLERWDRLLRAFRISSPLERLFQSGWQILEDLDRRVFVQSSSSSVRTLVVEDVVFSGDQVEPRSEVDMVAEALAYLLPPNHEEQTRSRFQKNLIILPDAILLPLLRRVTPVVARIQLTSGKTTSPYRPPGASDEERGNLWYEEHLPMDCLFGQVIGVRPDMAELREYGGDALEWFETSWGSSRTVQLGGNETVGQGLSWWTIGKGESYVTS